MSTVEYGNTRAGKPPRNFALWSIRHQTAMLFGVENNTEGAQ
jgi:hypothetical protein